MTQQLRVRPKSRLTRSPHLVRLRIAGVRALERAVDGWAPVGTAISLTSTTSEFVTTWKGNVSLPVARGTQPMRILISEAEQYTTQDPGDATQRVTYFDAIQI
jgi:hypothetical protein